MSDPIELPDRLPSSSAAALTQLLGEPEARCIRIDGRRVRMIGALAADQLADFVFRTEAIGGRVFIEASADMADDLRLLGLHDHLFQKGAE